MTAETVSTAGCSPLRVKAVVGAAVIVLAVAGCSGSAAPATVPSSASSTSTSSETSQGSESTVTATESSTSTAGSTEAIVGEAENETAREVGSQDATTSEQEGPADATGSEQDYTDDAGQFIDKHEYPDDPEPAASVVATLCNLNRPYFKGLQPTMAGEPVVDETLSMAVLGLSDLLDNWDGLRPHYPEVGADIDTAWAIRDSWDEALLNMENGETAAAQEAMAQAQELIEQLPATSLDECINSDPGEG